MTTTPDTNPPAAPAETGEATFAGSNLGSWGPKLGLWAWSFVGAVVALAIIVAAGAAVSEIILPLIFAAVLAICFKPLAGSLERRGLKPSVAAVVVVLGLIAIAIAVVVATARGVADQTSEISRSVDAAIDKLVAQVEVDPATLESIRASVEGAAPAVSGGFLAELVEGVSTVIALASGLILGSLIMYYLLKDGGALRKSFVGQFGPATRGEVDGFVGDACRTLRDYGRGRTVMAAIVAVVVGLVALLLGLPLVFTIVVVNFIGGYIPYIGAFLGGGLAVVIALGEGGIDTAVIMLVAVLASNLLLENFVEPKVMGRTLDIHPLVVLVVTALGGLLGGIVGLILAVPAWVVATQALARLRKNGFFSRAVDRAEPAVRQMLS